MQLKNISFYDEKTPLKLRSAKKIQLSIVIQELNIASNYHGGSINNTNNYV